MNIGAHAHRAVIKYSDEFNPANHLKEINYSESKTPAVKYEYDADDNRVKMIDGTGKTTYVYDQLDRLVQSVDGHGDGNLLTRTYDNAGRLQSIVDWLKNTTIFAP